MLGDVIELSIVVKDLAAAIKRFGTLFDLKVHERMEVKQFGFKNAILPLGRGHIELMQPIDPSSAVARFLEKRGEGVYLVGFEVEDVTASTKKLQERGARVAQPDPNVPLAWVHPKETHGVFVELRKPESSVLELKSKED